jgi:TonB-linked SusC/RagA family outer membrane protein
VNRHMLKKRLGNSGRFRGGGYVSGGLVTALLAVGLAVAPVGVAAQQGNIGGVVVDAQTGRALPSAQVFIAGTNQGVLTNQTGRFLFVGVDRGPVQVQVKMIGYADASMEANPGDMNLRFEMKVSAVSLDEIVVTGTPGATAKKAIGNVVSTLDAAQITRQAPVTDLQQVLNGRVAGLTVLSSTGEVGGASRIHIRGASTFSLSNTPLIYIDGVRVNNNEASGPINQGFGSRSISRLSDLDPGDIQSIEVIKGPAAATLYGTEAANGVIQIITKRGIQGAPRFTVQVKQGSNWFANPAGRLWTNWGMVNGQLQSLDFNQLQQNWITMQNNLGETPKNIFQNGYLQSYDASMTGGSSFVQYFMSAGYEHNTGVEPTNKVRKGNGRLNVTITPNEKWRIDGTLGYVVGRTDLACEAGCGGVTWTTYFMSPDKVSDPNRMGFWSGTPDSYHALYWTWQDVGRFTGSVQINNNPTSWFSHRLTFGLDQTHTQDHDLMNHDDRYTYYDSFADRGYADVVDNRVNYTTLDYSATIKRDITGNLHSSTSVGGQYYRRHDDYVEAYGEGFPVPGLTAVDATTQNRTSSQTYVNNTTVGVYGQEQLNWRDTRFVTVGLRADDNSAFGKNFNMVYYPKVSGTWVLSDEPFMNLPAVNTLRLRAAYGQSGQQPEQYAALRTFNPVTGPNDVGTVTPGTVGNPNLGPERSSEVEVGFDAGFLDDRLGLEVTYYNEHTRDAILLRQIAPSTGFTGSQWVNAGRIDNRGIEVTLHGTPYQTEKVRWDFGFNISTDHNEVVSLGDVTSEDFVQAGSYVKHKIGYPVGSWFSQRVVSAQLDANGNAVKSSMMCDDGAGGTTACYSAGGSLIAPEVFLGRNLPKVDGGFNTTVTLFGNLRLYGQVDFKTGYSKLDGNQRVRCFFFDLCRENYVPQDYDPVKIAEIQNGLVDVLIHPASFAKLRELSASYDFPVDIAGRIGARSLSLTVAGRNLTTWTKYPGLEPEATFNGGSRGGSYSLWEQDVLPQLAQFVATLHVGF